MLITQCPENREAQMNGSLITHVLVREREKAKKGKKEEGMGETSSCVHLLFYMALGSR